MFISRNISLVRNRVLEQFHEQRQETFRSVRSLYWQPGVIHMEGERYLAQWEGMWITRLDTRAVVHKGPSLRYVFRAPYGAPGRAAGETVCSASSRAGRRLLPAAPAARPSRNWTTRFERRSIRPGPSAPPARVLNILTQGSDFHEQALGGNRLGGHAPRRLRR